MEKELKGLVGLHMLDAVDFETVSLPAYDGADYTEDSQTCRFRLGGTVWAAVQDPDDGYRSSMRSLTNLRDAKMQNTFPPVQVMAIHSVSREYDKCDILTLYDVKTGEPVLEVGTDNTDDYYPSFVANFSPENMSTNAAIAQPQTDGVKEALQDALRFISDINNAHASVRKLRNAIAALSSPQHPSGE